MTVMEVKWIENFVDVGTLNTVTNVLIWSYRIFSETGEMGTREESIGGIHDTALNVVEVSAELKHRVSNEGTTGNRSAVD